MEDHPRPIHGQPTARCHGRHPDRNMERPHRQPGSNADYLSIEIFACRVDEAARQPDLFVTPTPAPFKEGWNCDPPRTPQLIRPSGAGNSPGQPRSRGAGRARHPGNQP